jgi:uncharacterized protein
MDRKKRFKKAKYILLGILTTLLTLLVYSLFIEPNLFVVTHHQLNPSNSRQTQTLKLVQVSDLHLKNFNIRAEKIADRIDRLKPDLIVFTGDIIDRPNKLAELNQFLSFIDLKTPKYATLGNWEHWSGVDLKALAELYQSHNCQLLVNRSVLFSTKAKKSLLITGLDDFTGGKPDLTASFKNIAPHANHLILAHSPGYRDAISPKETSKLAKYSPEYMLSGHTHGGQIVLFGWAPLRPPGSGKYLSGWYKDANNSTALYVSRGLGVSSIPLRIGAMPEIGYFEWSMRGEG